MVRFNLRARATIVTALFGALFAPATQAADFPAIEPPPVEEGPVEWGSNWYLRGDFGIAETHPTDLNGVALANRFPNNWSIGLGGGYKFNNWLRGDVTVEYLNLYAKSGVRTDIILPCEIGLYLDATQPTGVSSIPSACSPWIRNRTESMLNMANAYLDLGNWWGITPYVGAGVGVNVLYQRAANNWYMYNGVPYAGVTYTDPRNGATYMANWDTKYESTSLRLAYAFMGGVSYDIDNHWKIDVGYRWANLGSISGINRYNQPITTNLIQQSVRMGFRYMID
ncbi:outer membrane protein [Methylocystis parvus]|uniref:Porin family protein n=1 Tax=Methylocystis parvus TaxID=134 RepID=A0A6B8M905_9HYPH|nr:outer membrane beta-barrel protein [Methylocystis parvus]QGM97200.1 porin family protein [Methylocystis parvus]WBJ98893.1 outer membrane beta-barrel protein [Methylocystis parvus OBBP]